MITVLQSEENFMVKSWHVGSPDVSPPLPRDLDRHPPPHSCNESIIVLGLHVCTRGARLLSFFHFVNLSRLSPVFELHICLV